jgi:outer membrane protein, heavy metal efflux system
MRAVLLGCALAAWTPIPVTAEPVPLALEPAIDLALAQQPLLAAQSARAHAAHRRAASAAELPDPQLVAGIENLPLGSLDPWAADAEDMTMTTVGLMQEFPNAAKRRSRAQAERLQAAGGDADTAALVLEIRRDTALAWIDVWRSQQAVALIAPLHAELARSRELSAIALRSGRATQAEVHASTIALALAADRDQQAQQSLQIARARLARWIGDAAEGPLAAPPEPAPAPPLQPALAALDLHPQLHRAGLSADAAQAGVQFARAAYRPDWRVQAMYGYRRPHDDMLSLQFGVDLPLFTARRQDPGLAAALAEADAAQADRDALHRALVAELAAAHRAQSVLQTRLADYDSLLLPTAQARIDAAVAAYGSGSSGLDAVLDARTQALELQLMRLDLHAELLRQHVLLRYLTAETRS